MVIIDLAGAFCQGLSALAKFVIVSFGVSCLGGFLVGRKIKSISGANMNDHPRLTAVFARLSFGRTSGKKPARKATDNPKWEVSIIISISLCHFLSSQTLVIIISEGNTFKHVLFVP